MPADPNANHRHPLHATWKMMRQRCNNPKAYAYERYGGRGIRVCSRWDDFRAFVADMGPRPPGTTLDRINNDGDYTPRNCRWATRREQNNNARNCRPITFRGETRNLNQWARHLGMNEVTLSNRINTLGWSVERALSTPVKRSRS